MRISVVISTVNRADSLRQTLNALRWQTHNDFEVVVVNGPSTDDTEQVLADYAGRIRTTKCPEANLSKSRNCGIALACGEIAAFIDDDAIAEPDWLEELENAYSSDDVCAAGGIVFDHTGCALQYEYSASDRLGQTRYDLQPPLRRYTVPGAETFLYLQGTNMSFRREFLVELGGFDEEIEYNFDEVEVCLHAIDQGHLIRPLAGAAVHHKYLASHVRNSKRLFIDPYFSIKNRAYFALSHGQRTHSITEIMASLTTHVEELKAVAAHQQRDGLLNRQEQAYFLERVDQGFEVGINRGLDRERQSVMITNAIPSSFLPFPTKSSENNVRPLRVCFVSQEYPPGDFGGIGRFTADLATGFASEGHEVHVVTRALDERCVDFEDGVWIHRTVTTNHGLDAIVNSNLRSNLDHVATVYEEVTELHNRRPINVVSAPLWGAEGLVCSLDPRWATVTTLMTTLHTIANLHKSWEGSPDIEASLRLERVAIESSDHIHAISKAILDEVSANFDISSASRYVVPLGTRDIRRQSHRTNARAGDIVEILFVGRLEFRKGVDVLLDAIVQLHKEGQNVHFTLAGKDTINTELGETYQVAFRRRAKGLPELAAMVDFVGMVSDEELHQLYANCDIFCAPSRYESFGLVLLEAMRYGVPVIACRVGGMPEIVDDGESGELAEPDDVESLVQCLHALIRNPMRRMELGNAARKRYEDHYSLDTAVRRTVDAYSEAARGHQRGSEGHLPVVARRLGDSLVKIAQLDRVTARRTAERMLLMTRSNTDVLAELEDVWEAPDEEFVNAAYYAVFGGPPDPPGLRIARDTLARGSSRVLFVRGLARSDVARGRGINTEWVPQLVQLMGDDYLDRLEVAWSLPDHEFVGCVYEILLGRELEEPATTIWLDRMRKGLPRSQLVREIANYDEARAEMLDLRWLASFEATAVKWERLRDADTPIRVRLQRKAARLPLIGAAGRRARRTGARARGVGASVRELVLLPRNLRSLETDLTAKQLTLVDTIGRIELQVSAVRVLGPRLDRLEDAVMQQLAETASTSTRLIEPIMHANARAETSAEALLQLAGELRDHVIHQGISVDRAVERLDILQTKSEALSLDLREQVLTPREGRHVAAFVPNAVTYRERLATMNGALRVNLGCGEKPLPGYLNIDFRELPGVDLVADACELPFEDETLSELASAHLVEHFREHQFRTVILPHWRRLLKTGGRLRIVCPNWSVMIDRVQAGTMTLDVFKKLTFGLQDYSGDDHFAMYTPESLTNILRGASFGSIELITLDRQNGLCPEMELTATAQGASKADVVGVAHHD